MSIRFHHIRPHFLLENYIEKLWLFEADGSMPSDDMKLVVPNGNLKLTLSFQNGIVADVSGNRFSSKEQDITLTGLVDVPVILDVEKDSRTKTIGIEFSPQGAYRFFHFTLNELQNRIYPLSDLLGATGKGLVEELSNTAPINKKIDLLQAFLIQQLSRNREDAIFEYCVKQILDSQGLIAVKELERRTGYSSRWLNMKFNDKLGVSPKNLCSIIRFSQFYQSHINGKQNELQKRDFYHFYYDQSHFIKDFKRFTGLPPKRFEIQANHFGEAYFKS